MVKLFIALGLIVVSLTASIAEARSQADVLPSWNEGASRAAITSFVERVTKIDGPDFVPVSERIATFDNDGTLWVEKPVYVQMAFALDRIKALAAINPRLGSAEPFETLKSNVDAAADARRRSLLSIIALTHSGMTVGEFEETVQDWIKTARHPRFNRLYTELVYQPMLELMQYLRENGFKTYIVSGGGIDFMRPWTDRVYGIPPEQVIGSSGVVEFRLGDDGKPQLIKTAEVDFVNDGPGKPVAIQQRIGRHPILAIGNSDGDLEMLQYVSAGPGARLVLFVHHDDDEREYSYDRNSAIGKLDRGLDEAKAKGWPIISMKDDWKVIFAPH